MLVGGDWNHGSLNDFPERVGNFIIPTDFHSIIFQRGRLKPPAIRLLLSIINHIITIHINHILMVYYQAMVGLNHQPVIVLRFGANKTNAFRSPGHSYPELRTSTTTGGTTAHDSYPIQ